MCSTHELTGIKHHGNPICHLLLQGVLSLKNTHFEPRYVLTMPYSPQVAMFDNLPHSILYVS